MPIVQLKLVSLTSLKAGLHDSFTQLCDCSNGVLVWISVGNVTIIELLRVISRMRTRACGALELLVARLAVPVRLASAAIVSSNCNTFPLMCSVPCSRIPLVRSVIDLQLHLSLMLLPLYLNHPNPIHRDTLNNFTFFLYCLFQLNFKLS